MRKQITKPVNAKKGDSVVVACRLRRSQSYARLSLWAACGGDDFSPYVHYGMIGTLYEGKPKLVKPYYIRLVIEGIRSHTWQINCEEDLTFCVVQEVDTSDEVLAKARIRVYGKATTRAGRTLQNAIRFLRRCTENFIRHYA